MRIIPSVSIIQAIGAAALALMTTAAVPMCNSDSGPSASMKISANATSAAPSTSTVASTAGPGLPADFPLPPGLSPCKPLDAGGEIICEWHNVDGHAMYNFYLGALPKAGYTLHPGAPKVMPPEYNGPLSLGFKKGRAQGAVTVAAGTLTIQYLPHQ
jgi:hypothetical protein